MGKITGSVGNVGVHENHIQYCARPQDQQNQSYMGMLLRFLDLNRGKASIDNTSAKIRWILREIDRLPMKIKKSIPVAEVNMKGKGEAIYS